MISRSRLILFRVLAIVAALVAILNSQFSNPQPVRAQPTYKLDVKPDLTPLATLRLEGTRVVRTDLADDPGFRLQYHVKATDGKSLLTAEARSSAVLELPVQTAGRFSVVLELFYPAYKGGNDQKGEFRAVSNVITYKNEGGKIILIPPPKVAAIY